MVARSVGAEARNPKWTSYGALEIDVFARSKPDFEVFLAILEPLATIEFSRDLNEAPRFQTKEQLVSEARTCFNAERFWECHEVLESIWRNLSGDEKLFVQGLILVCAAFVHVQKDELPVALGVLQRAARQLDYGGGFYHGIKVAELKMNVDEILRSQRFSVFKI